MLPHNESILNTTNIIYDDKTKKNIINEILNVGMQFIGMFGSTVEEMAIDGVSDALFYYFALMKDGHFEHEKESRLLYPLKEFNKVSFRRKGNIILPYLKLKILDCNCRPHLLLPIEEIVISPGPQKEYIAESVKHFLEFSGYKYLIDKVKTSAIPYREQA